MAVEKDDYRKDFREASSDVYWSIPRIAGWCIAVGVAVVVVGFVLKPFAVVKEATDGAVLKYEFFHDANQQIAARVAQIKGHAALISKETDAAELRRLKIEMAGQQQSCRDLVAKYNANAAKTNHSIFMGKEAPASQDPNVCEVKS